MKLVSAGLGLAGRVGVGMTARDVTQKPAGLLVVECPECDLSITGGGQRQPGPLQWLDRSLPNLFLGCGPSQ